MCRRINSWNLNITRERVGRAVFLHFGKASLAACTAALNSLSVVCGRRETTSWVACTRQAGKLQIVPLQQLILSEFENYAIVNLMMPDNHKVLRWPLTGLVTSTHSVACDSLNSPSMRSLTEGCKSHKGLTYWCSVSSIATSRQNVMTSKRHENIPECRWRALAAQQRILLPGGEH